MTCATKRPKSETLLNEFALYCIAHPDERFWQALRNWSQMCFIMAIPWDGPNASDEAKVYQFDTFYWEGKNK
jgi:hypothetical protein